MLSILKIISESETTKDYKLDVQNSAINLNMDKYKVHNLNVCILTTFSSVHLKDLGIYDNLNIGIYVSRIFLFN